MSEATAKHPAASSDTKSAALASIAEGIAANLTQSREGPIATPGESKEPDAEAVERPAESVQAEESVTEEAQGPERQEQQEQQEQERQDAEEAREADEDSPSEPQRYSLSDFAEATGEADGDIESRLFVQVEDRDGTTREVSVAELRRDYRGNAATTQTMQELAEQRKALDARFSEVSTIQDQAEAIITQQFAKIDEAEALLQKRIEATDWAALQAARDGSYADAQAFVTAQRAEFQAERDKLEAAKAEVGDSRAKQREQYMAEVLPKAREQLLDMIPEWRSEETAAREGQEVAEFALSQGFTIEEYNACIDPRMFRMFRNAWLMSKREAAGKAARKRVESAPKLSVKPGRRVTADEARAKERAEVLSRADSGKPKDIAAVILHDLTQANRR